MGRLLSLSQRKRPDLHGSPRPVPERDHLPGIMFAVKDGACRCGPTCPMLLVPRRSPSPGWPVDACFSWWCRWCRMPKRGDLYLDRGDHRARSPPVVRRCSRPRLDELRSGISTLSTGPPCWRPPARPFPDRQEARGRPPCRCRMRLLGRVALLGIRPPRRGPTRSRRKSPHRDAMGARSAAGGMKVTLMNEPSGRALTSLALIDVHHSLALARITSRPWSSPARPIPRPVPAS